MQHYGWRYDYSARTVERDMRIGPLPQWLLDIAGRLYTKTGGIRPRARSGDRERVRTRPGDRHARGSTVFRPDGRHDFRSATNGGWT